MGPTWAALGLCLAGAAFLSNLAKTKLRIREAPLALLTVLSKFFILAQCLNYDRHVQN